MGKLTIERSNERVNRIRKIKIFLDGELIGTIDNRETKQFDVPEGVHTLQAKIDWCTSNAVTFAVAEQENKRFYLSSFALHNRMGSLAGLFYITIATDRYLRLEEET